VAGFSMGATIAALATRRPDLVAALVAVGMDIDGPAAESSAYQFALAAARARNNRRAIRQLEAIGPPPHLEPKEFRDARPGGLPTSEGWRTGHTYNSVAAPCWSACFAPPTTPRGHRPGHPGDHGGASRAGAGAGGA